MSEEFMSRLFIPFEQEAHTIAKKYGGTGLGMAITKNLVNLLGGTIWLRPAGIISGDEYKKSASLTGALSLTCCYQY